MNTRKNPTANGASITTDELAARWRVSPASLRNRRVAGLPPAYIKIGSSVRYPLSLILMFEEANLTNSTTQETKHG